MKRSLIENDNLTPVEILTAAILAIVARGDRTVAQIERQLADGRAYVEARGAQNVEPELLMALTAIEMALAWIERERVKYDRLKNN